MIREPSVGVEAEEIRRADSAVGACDVLRLVVDIGKRADHAVARRRLHVLERVVGIGDRVVAGDRDAAHAVARRDRARRARSCRSPPDIRAVVADEHHDEAVLARATIRAYAGCRRSRQIERCGFPARLSRRRRRCGHGRLLWRRSAISAWHNRSSFLVPATSQQMSVPRFHCDRAARRRDVGPRDRASASAAARHARGLRLRAGDAIVVVHRARRRISRTHHADRQARRGRADRSLRSGRARIARDMTLVQSLIAADMMDLVVRKAVELGAAAHRAGDRGAQPANPRSSARKADRALAADRRRRVRAMRAQSHSFRGGDRAAGDMARRVGRSRTAMPSGSARRRLATRSRRSRAHGSPARY